MITNAGDFPTNATVYIPFNTFDSNDPTASVTITNLASTDIHIHKDGGTTQRTSANGITVSIDFDSITGNHLVSIDLSDNSDAGFYAAGSEYQVRMEGTTVDAATVNAWIGMFSIARSGGTATVLTDTEAVLTDTEAVLTDSEAILTDSEAILVDTGTTLDTVVDSILVDTEAIITDTEAILVDTGTTLLADTEAILADTNELQTDDYPTTLTALLADTEAILTDTGTTLLADTEAILADTEATSTTAIADQVWDELQSAHVTAGSFGEIATEMASVLTDTEAVLTDSEAILGDTETAAAVLTDTEAILADSEAILTDTGTTLLADTEAILADTETGGTAAILADTEAIVAKTDSLTFTTAGQVDANIQYVNDVAVGGTGAAGDEWGPA